jgi:MFS family permease
MMILSLPLIHLREATSIPRRWIVVAAATLGLLIAFGLTTTVSILIKPFEAEFGWSRSDISYAYSLLSAGAALGGLVVGWTFDRVDSRIIVAFGSVVMAAGLLVLSFSSTLRLVHVVYLAIGVAGFACFYTPCIAIVGLWFDKGRGLAMGFVTAGGAIGQGVTPLLLQPMINVYGWRTTCAFLAAALLVVFAPIMLLVRKPDELATTALAEVADPLPLPPAVSIAWLSLAAVFCCASMAVPLVHLIPLLLDRGESIAVSGSLMFVAMLAASVGRIVIGMICDRIGALGGYVLAVLLQSITVYWFVPLQSHATLYLLAATFGFGFGGVMTALVLCVRASVPARMAGFGMALVGTLAWAGMGFGGYQGAYCYDLTGSYSTSFLSAALAGAANLLIVAGFLLHRRWHAHILRAFRTPDRRALALVRRKPI